MGWFDGLLLIHIGIYACMQVKFPSFWNISTSALTVSKRENFDIFSLKSDTQNTFYLIVTSCLKEGIKTPIFYGQAGRKGDSAPSALTISKCDNLDHFF